MRIKCYLKAIIDFLRYGVWVPHLFQEDNRRGAIIIAGDDYFRVAHSYEHTPEEHVYKDAVLIQYKCINCGKVDYGWIKDWRESVPVLK